jgi:hypothetical protein
MKRHDVAKREWFTRAKASRPSQIDKKYEELSEEEKESDREQVRKYLPLIASAISSKIEPS